MRSVRHYALCALLVCGTILPIPFLSHRVHAEEAQDWIDRERLYSHVEQLARTARPPATETEFAAAVYVENTLQSYGYKTKLDPFSYYTYRNPTTLSLTMEEWPGQKWTVSGFTFGINGTATAQVVDAGLGRAVDFANDASRGKIALVKRGDISFGEKVRQAAAAGAVGLIIWNDREEGWNASLGEPLDIAVPVIALSKADGTKLQKRILDKQPVKGTVKVEGAVTTKQTSYNIVASRKPNQNDTGQVVMVSAHHDSAGLSAGANHNGSGVAALLEIARNIADKPIDTEVRFVSFGAATSGSRGPIAYANALSAKDRQAMIAAFYIEGVGSQKAELVATNSQGNENLPTQLLRAAGVSPTDKDGKRERNGAADSLAAAGIPTALVTSAGMGQTTDDSIAQIDWAQIATATKAVLSAIDKITEQTTPAYPIGSPNGGQRRAESESLQ
ncbi:M28 family peptidase [Brevibacillus sp. M2.1A]|uniref:M28 family peptidase n=1 Tax=Brevibacillus TaxID=55080 RepID=UPI00156AFFDB|nr:MULTISPECIES: M28 family peptidase [Brevibacillus]MBY0084565.1 M28 family peptidase [Brevibacillus brevis]MCC8435889.1 M28 family peptidase [Brevibacillus sp. M2.1A]MCE0449092.1 M28 family peptidase [Brevibacillus sp. AF8]UKK98114.1 M28 family peptidase [Brevibacillus brevis]